MTEAFNKEDVIEHLSKVQIREIGRRHENDKRLRMIDPKLLQSFSVKGVSECYHMSCVTSETVWVSDRLNILISFWQTQQVMLFYSGKIYVRMV